MATIKVERPKDPAGIRALIRKRRKNIERLEAVLAMPMPLQDKRHLQQRLHGERMNLRSWEDHLAKITAKKGR